MKRLALALLLFAATVFPAAAQQYQDIDVDLPAYPEMEPIPDSPVYYAPGVESNYFFYDGLYWDYYNDAWYSSAWYNGPWAFVDPIYVPTYLLWVPIRFYRRPPHYFRGWNRDRPPRWGQHWGADWQNRHNAVYGGQRLSAGRAPLPDYQRSYDRNNYPRAAQQQQDLHVRNYGYQPRDGYVRQQYENRGLERQPTVDSRRTDDRRSSDDRRSDDSRGDDRRSFDSRRDDSGGGRRERAR